MEAIYAALMGTPGVDFLERRARTSRQPFVAPATKVRQWGIDRNPIGDRLINLPHRIPAPLHLGGSYSLDLVLHDPLVAEWVQQ